MQPDLLRLPLKTASRQDQRGKQQAPVAAKTDTPSISATASHVLDLYTSDKDEGYGVNMRRQGEKQVIRSSIRAFHLDNNSLKIGVVLL